MTSSPPLTLREMARSPPPRIDRADTLKSSILASSQIGWNSSSNVVSPLKISKQSKPSPRNSPSTMASRFEKAGKEIPAVARRSSSSFKHVRTNNLVSNSPWKSPTLGSDEASGPIGPKYKPLPQSQTGGYKVLPKASKGPGASPRRVSPAIVQQRRVSPAAAATRRASLEKRKRISQQENIQRLLDQDTASEAEVEDLGLPTRGVPRRRSRGLQSLEKAEYVSKSPFAPKRQISDSMVSSPALTSATSSPQFDDVGEPDEPTTPSASESSPAIAMEDNRQDEISTNPNFIEEAVTQQLAIPKHASDSPSGFSPRSGRPLPASPRARRAAGSYTMEEDTPQRRRPSMDEEHHQTPSPMPSITTPHKSSLKSKRRLLGPRSPDSEGERVARTSSGRRRYGSIRRQFVRRKTVTFDERCAVLEFEPDEVEDVVDSEWATSEGEDEDGDLGHDVGKYMMEHHSMDTDGDGEHGSFEIQNEEVDSIQGLVNSILQDEIANFERPDPEHRNDFSPDHSGDSRHSLDFHIGNSSLDFQPPNTSLDFQPSNTSLDFHAPNTSFDFNPGNRSLDFHEGDSFEVDMFSSTPHLFTHNRRSLSVVDEDDPPRAEEETAVDLASPPRPDDNDRTFIVEVEGPNYGSSGSLASASSRVTELTRSESTDSRSGRTSPRISREDVRRRLLQQKAGTSLSLTRQEEIDSDDAPDAFFSPPSAFSRRSLIRTPSDDRPLPSLPPAPQMDRHPFSHEPALQTTQHEDADPPRSEPLMRSLTTDGNLPNDPYTPPASDQTFGYRASVTDINDVKSALERLMIGVENGFEDDGTEPPVGDRRPRPNSMGAVPQGHPIEHHQLEAIRSSEASPLSRQPSRNTPHPDDIYAGTGRSINDTSLAAPKAKVTRVKSGKEIIKAHEAAIIAKRREIRRREAEENGEELEVPLRRPSKRRSLSTGDAEDVRREQRRALIEETAELLDVPVEEVDLPLTDSIDRELRKLTDEKQPTYRLRERDPVYASTDDRIRHSGRAGDVDGGKAWRAVRRPSDMNEYARQIREYRNQEKPGKAHGKVFVKVLGIRNITIPLPSQPTSFNVTLNNGIHCVATPDCQLASECRVDQEFELIEHGQLEFTLTIKVRRDPHVLALGKSVALPRQIPILATVAPPPIQPKSGGLFGLFGGSKKTRTHKRAMTQPEIVAPPPPMPRRNVEENLAKYMHADGSLATAFVSFKDIAKRCDTRLFETAFPLFAQVAERRSTISDPKQIGEIVLQLFRLPPLPGIKPNQLPQSLEECHRGLRHIAWHKVTYFEGVLTQNGGDCSTWRRRHIKVIGANLVAFNDITNKATATIELKKALGVVDDHDPEDMVAAKDRFPDIGVSMYHVERSFRLIFPDEEEIAFFADSDAEKSRWLDILRALIGRIPPNPLWAELVWQRQEEGIDGPRRSSVAPATRQSSA